MKRVRLIGLMGLMVFAGRMPALPVDLITATVTVTNTAGVTNLSTLTVNGDTRTWTTNVTTPATQILTNSTDLTSATNLFNAIASAPFAGLTLTRSSSNGIALRGTPGGALVVSLGGTWGVVTLATNSLTPAVAVRVPYSVESPAQRTNVASGLVAAIAGPENTNSIYENARAVIHLVGITNVQTVTGAKTFSSVSGTVGALTNGTWVGGTLTNATLFGTVGGFTNGAWTDATLTNGVNYGNAFSSPGTGVQSEQFGSAATASGISSTAVGNQATATGDNSSALGEETLAPGLSSTAVGSLAEASAFSSLAVGTGASATKDNASALGVFSAAHHTNSTAVGYQATTTADNQVMLGSAGVSVSVNNALTVGASAAVTADLTVAGKIKGVSFGNTNGFPSGSDIAFGRYALSSLANGNNAGIPVGTNVFVEVSGPSAAFTINGIAGGRDGKFLIILNQTTQNMTIAHDSGTDPTAANRILTMTAADRATTGNGAAMLIYSGAASRWILISLDQ